LIHAAGVKPKYCRQGRRQKIFLGWGSNGK